MCQLSSTATICDSCRHLINYTSSKSFCPLVFNLVASNLSLNTVDGMGERLCLEEPEDITRYVPRHFCKRCDGK